MLAISQLSLMQLAILGVIDTTYAAYQSKIMKLTNLKQVKR